MRSLTGLFVLDRSAYDAVYAPQAAGEIARRVRIIDGPQTRESLRASLGLLADVDLIFSGWGMPRSDAAFMSAAPHLRAIFYAAGAVGGWATPALWERDIVVTTANDANAIPVADYTVAMTLLALKHGLRLACGPRRAEGFRLRPELPGNYGTTVGLVGMGTIARLVVERLRPFGMRVVACDPFLDAVDAAALGVERVDLAGLFAGSDVVSLHAADLPSTRGMVDGDLIRSMRSGATLINTSRGRLVRENELAGVLRDRPDLHAVLDVTETEPLAADSPLMSLDNVTLTPHIAGSQGRECRRMGQYMVEELDRYLAGKPLRWQVNPAVAIHSVHQPAFARPATPLKITA